MFMFYSVISVYPAITIGTMFSVVNNCFLYLSLPRKASVPGFAELRDETPSSSTSPSPCKTRPKRLQAFSNNWKWKLESNNEAHLQGHWIIPSFCSGKILQINPKNIWFNKGQATILRHWTNTQKCFKNQSHNWID